jgi:hypothetical protein
MEKQLKKEIVLKLARELYKESVHVYGDQVRCATPATCFNLAEQYIDAQEIYADNSNGSSLSSEELAIQIADER